MVYADFNSLAPCGANLSGDRRDRHGGRFQLTRPVWGEPLSIVSSVQNVTISTHSPRVGRTLTAGDVVGDMQHFNSLAPCGANPEPIGDLGEYKKFQLTRPVWGEPLIAYLIRNSSRISTHSPRVGRTRKLIADNAINANFNSLAPCGANLQEGNYVTRPDKFQLTRPVWGEPQPLYDLRDLVQISTHSPRVGRTRLHVLPELSAAGFQLTRPVWGEPWGCAYTWR